jgi:membrane protein
MGSHASRNTNAFAVLPAVWQASHERHLGLLAAGVAFYAMLAVFPGLSALVVLWSFWADPAVMRQYLALAEDFMPADAMHLIEDELDRLLLSGGAARGWTALVTTSIGLWSAWSAVHALIDGLNAVHARGHRPGAMRHAVATVLTLALIGLLLAALASIVSIPAILAFAPPGPWTGVMLKAAQTGILFLAILVFLGIFYRWGPNLVPRPGWLTVGGVVAAILWAAASLAFTLYLARFGTYSRIYGSIGAVIALLMWFYISAYIILVGGTINAERARLASHAAQ